MEYVSDKGGGIMINRGLTSDVRMSDETITNIMKEYKVNNAEIIFRGKCSVDDLIDSIEGNISWWLNWLYWRK